MTRLDADYTGGVVPVGRNKGVGKVEADPLTPDPDAIKMFVGQVPRSMEEVNIVNMATIRSF